uniref:Transglutaminase-like domain-containing protein n=1 Tax=viral metagenome TaxID=1070528 RepID=A0A6C0BEG6_9ZZZZ
MYSCRTLSEGYTSPFDKISSIGRYTRNVDGKDYILDIVFDRVEPKLSSGYINGNFGNYNMWTYDLDCIEMRELVMEWIDMIPHNERDIRRVVRHIMYCMSYDNIGDKALIIGKWGSGCLIDGKPPTYWKNSKHIFTERKKLGKALKYGQCWCFAECMTSILRFLGIATRTVCGRNTLIDENLDGGVDFVDELKKGDSLDFESSDKWNLIDRSNIDLTMNNLVNGIQEKGESWDPKHVYKAGDSYWNIHYWNEVYIPINENEIINSISSINNTNYSWEVIDSTPIIPSTYDDLYKESKIAGPCKIQSFRLNNFENNYDFKRIFSMVNSPFRLWSVTSYIKDDQIIDVPYIYSLIYTFRKSISCYINNKRVNKLFNSLPKIYIKEYTTNYYNYVDITKNYIGSKEKIMEIYFKNIAFLEDDLYIQLVYIDILGNVLGVDIRNGTIEDEIKKCNNEDIKKRFPSCYIVSYLIIENFNGDFCFINNEKNDVNYGNIKENHKKRRWSAFCEYFKN